MLFVLFMCPARSVANMIISAVHTEFFIVFHDLLKFVYVCLISETSVHFNIGRLSINQSVVQVLNLRIYGF